MLCEFSRSELQHLLAAVDNMREDIEDFIPRTPLASKLQTLIANYCDHNWKFLDSFTNDCLCLKCGIIYP